MKIRSDGSQLPPYTVEELLQWMEAKGLAPSNMLAQWRAQAAHHATQVPEADLRQEIANLWLARRAHERIGEKSRSAAILVASKHLKGHRDGGIAKRERDPKQEAKKRAHEMFLKWQAGETRYKNQTAFANYVVDNITDAKGAPVLESIKVVMRWCKEWRS